MMARKDPSKGNPRTGDGKKAKGKKPTDTGILQMRKDGHSHSMPPQPKGWGIAKVVHIFSKKKGN